MYRRLLFLALALGLSVGVAGGSTLKINFQSSGAPIPEGYLPDYGDVFGDRGNGFSYGWDLDIKGDARDRNSGNAPDQRYDTINHLQKSGRKVWEIELPNGTYNVHLVCGDPSYTDQTNNYDIDGIIMPDPDGQAGNGFDFDEFDVMVELTDGRLTITPAEGADNAKVCFVEIESDVLTRFFSAARDPDPPDGAEGVSIPLFRWTAGDTALFHDVYFGTTPDLGPDDLVSPRSFMTMYYHAPALEPGERYYWRIDEVEADGVTVVQGDVWSFVSLSLTAWKAGPADGAVDVLPDTRLTWATGMAAIPLKHALYFGQDADAVSDGAADVDKGVFEKPGYDPELLEPDTTYYWRVDQIEPDGTARRGDVWNFDTVAAGPGKIVHEWWFDISGGNVTSLTGNARYPNNPDGWEFVSTMEGPSNWAEQYGTRFRGWIFPPETGDYVFWIAAEDEGRLYLSTDEDPANAVLIASAPGTDPRSWEESPDQRSPSQKLVAGQTYYVEALMKENTMGDNIGVAWQGPGVPVREVLRADYVGATPFVSVKAYDPAPATRAVGVTQAPALAWKAGADASRHDVYFGTDAQAVAEADTTTADIYQGRQDATSYTPDVLEWDVTYYWRVDEIGADATVTTGRVWSFTTADFLIVDDFESYDEDMDGGTAIFQTWADGVENGTGSYVGYEVANSGTFSETVIVNSGHQSMPLQYDNSAAPFYSETSRTLETPRDWTVNGVDTLTIFIQGAGGNGAEPLYAALEDGAGNVAVVVHPNPDIAMLNVWTPWPIPLSEFGSAGVDLTSVKVISIGLGDRSAPAAGDAGTLYVDDVRVTKSGSVE